LELRLFTAVVAARPPAREEASPPSRARAAAAARGRARPQARLLDSCGRMAPRRARAVRTRDALAPDAEPPRFLPPSARSPRPRRPPRRTRRSLETALGPPLADALVRAARRGHHEGRLARAGSRGRMKHRLTVPTSGRTGFAGASVCVANLERQHLRHP